MRPAFLEIPDLQAALGYVLRLINTRQYRQQLALCKLDGCENFFLRELRQSRPECYCFPGHAKKGKKAATAARGRDFRARQKAIEQLKARYPASAAAMIKSVAESGLSAEELVKRAEAHAAARKHK